MYGTFLTVTVARTFLTAVFTFFRGLLVTISCLGCGLLDVDLLLAADAFAFLAVALGASLLCSAGRLTRLTRFRNALVATLFFGFLFGTCRLIESREVYFTNYVE